MIFWKNTTSLVIISNSKLIVPVDYFDTKKRNARSYEKRPVGAGLFGE